MTERLLVIGFDADDTLWQNETFYRVTEARFVDLLGDHADQDGLKARLHTIKVRNLGHYGFGIKGFMLSMVETAIEVTDGQVPASVIAKILEIGQEMLGHPIDLLDHAEETIRSLTQTHTLVLITKGDLLDQERKLAQSGLGDAFAGVEIVSRKSAATYRAAFARHGAGAESAMMIGNSLASDVRPALEAGAWGVFVPHGLTWAVEHAEPPTDAPRFREVPHLGHVAALVAEIEAT